MVVGAAARGDGRHASSRGKGFYRTLLIWPYAVAPAVAGMLWLFMFNPAIGTLRLSCCARPAIDWDPLLNGDQAMVLVVVAAAWKQISYNFLFFVAGLQAIPKIADRGRRDRRRRPGQALLDDRLPAARADHLLPAGRQHRLRLLRHLRHHPRRHRRRARQGDRDAGLQGLQRRLRELNLGSSAAQSVILMVDRHRAHRHPVPLRREAGALWLSAG